MGVTIHFEGKLRGREELHRCIALAQAMCEEQGWVFAPIERDEARLDRFFNEEKFEYVGPTRGISVYPHEDCDPVEIEFDNKLFLQEFTKTQFAGPEIHVAVIDLLRRIEPCFTALEVFDEGEFWETGNRAVLERHLAWFEEALAQRLRQSPGSQVKVKLPSGKIVDLMIDRAKERKQDVPWWKFWRRDA